VVNQLGQRRRRWTVQVHRTDTDELVTIGCSFLYVCTGYRYDEGYSPEIPGAEQTPGR
jgi:cation diffusion facilitator CzcD-associated flavoprotein CzcO